MALLCVEDRKTGAGKVEESPGNRGGEVKSPGGVKAPLCRESGHGPLHVTDGGYGRTE